MITSNNSELELSCCATLLSYHDNAVILCEQLADDDFFSPKCRAVFRAGLATQDLNGYQSAKKAGERMARPHKQTVDYFPHYCVHKNTMFIIEQRYGNDGYAFWFKLLEQLGSTEGHYLDMNDELAWEFLQAKTRLCDVSICSLLDTLSKLKAIDPELWSKRVIWCQNFVDNVAVVYKNRKVTTPSKPVNFGLLPVETGLLPVETTPEPGFHSLSTDGNRQSRVEYSKEEKKTPLPPLGENEGEKPSEDQKPKQTPPPDKPQNPKTMTAKLSSLFDEFWKHYPKKRAKGQAENTWVKINPDEQLHSVMLKAIEKAKAHDEQWKKDNGQFIPNPSTWLNAKGWMDEIKVDVPVQSEIPERRYFCAERDGATLYADSLPDPRTIKPGSVTI